MRGVDERAVKRRIPLRAVNGQAHHLEVRGRGARARMVWRPVQQTPCSAFVLRMPDGTCARVVAGVVRDVWIVGALALALAGSSSCTYLQRCERDPRCCVAPAKCEHVDAGPAAR